MEPTTVLPIISLLSLVSVEYGGWALLGFLTGRGQIGEFREQFFRAGHAHAGDRASGLGGLPRVPNSTSRRQRASARPTSSSRRTSGRPYRSWTAALISFGRTHRVAGSRAGRTRSRRAPSARGRNRVIAHQNSTPRAPVE